MRALPSLEDIQERLQHIFEPEGRPTLYNLTAARAVYALLYVDAVAGHTLARPTTVIWMDSANLVHTSDEDRRAWYAASRHGRDKVEDWHSERGTQWQGWLAENSREGIRDELFRDWRRLGAMYADETVPTTSSKPRWSLAPEFADLFDPYLTGDDLTAAIEGWQEDHLSAAGRAAVVQRRRKAGMASSVGVAMPDSTTRRLTPGPSSLIMKDFVERFVPAVLGEPAVLLLSESATQVDVVDQETLQTLELSIDQQRLLPDLLVFDAADGRFWFVEIVATDGAIDELRREKLVEWAASQAHPIPEEKCAFVTAFESRTAAPFKKLVGRLAWDTLAWFQDEPDYVVRFDELRRARLE